MWCHHLNCLVCSCGLGTLYLLTITLFRTEACNFSGRKNGGQGDEWTIKRKEFHFFALYFLYISEKIIIIVCLLVLGNLWVVTTLSVIRSWLALNKHTWSYSEYTLLVFACCAVYATAVGGHGKCGFCPEDIMPVWHVYNVKWLL